jgi:ABC-type branched-subunit amino acid transport system permease subunit
MSKRYQAVRHNRQQVSEEVIDTTYNDLPWQNAGARRFYLLLLVAFLLFYPVLDPMLFGYGTNGRLAAYGDAGYYVILALGLNIVVGFAGLLDLGYVAFFAIGAYTWGIVGSSQFTVLTNIPLNAQLWSWLFWPMLVIAALFTALWGVALGVPTLRLSGDYLAIVTLGFGEIVPVVVLEMDKISNGANGIIGVKSPAFPGISWSTITPLPYYYLIVALIAFSVFANIRWRDSRFGRAWLATSEDEVAAASSGINLVKTKLFAFAAGAFFSGIAGAYHAAKLGFVSPDDFNFGDSIIYLSMIVIGGIGSIPGVIVGALLVYSFNELVLSQLDTLSSNSGNIFYNITIAVERVAPGFTFGNIRNLIFGLLLVLLMIFRPEGLIPSVRRRSTLRIIKQKEQKIRADNEDERVKMVPLEGQQDEPDVDEGLHIEKL